MDLLNVLKTTTTHNFSAIINSARIEVLDLARFQSGRLIGYIT